MSIHKNTTETFLKYIKEVNGCWLWIGGTRSGYGSFRWKDKYRYAHCVAYEIYCGDIPDGIKVLHTCHNKLCCNPEHLKLGTHAQNKQDSDFAVLTWDDVHYIRDQYKQKNKTHQQLANELQVSTSHITNIINNKVWKE